MKTALIDADWLPVVGFEGYYEVSRRGQIRSIERAEFVDSVRTGGHLRVRKSRLLRSQVGSGGREFVTLQKKGAYRRCTVHRVVGLAFLDNPHNKPEINHKDGNPLNNHVDNLEWCTRQENMDHAIRTGLTRKGEYNGGSKLSSHDVLAIVEQLSLGRTQTKIAEDFGVTNHAIHKIAKGDNWSWLTGIRKGV